MRFFYIGMVGMVAFDYLKVTTYEIDRKVMSGSFGVVNVDENGGLNTTNPTLVPPPRSPWRPGKKLLEKLWPRSCPCAPDDCSCVGAASSAESSVPRCG